MKTRKQKLKIAIFHLGFFFSGGGEKLVLEETAELVRRGHEVSLFAPVVDKENCFPDLIKKVKVYSLFFPFSFNFPLRDFISIIGAVFLTPLTFFRYARFDVFFGANQPGPLICFFLAKILNKPYVIYLAQPTRLLYPRQIDLEEGFGKGSFNIFYFLTQFIRPIVLFLDRISIRKANAILVNGNYMAGILEKVYKIQVIVCPAGCHPREKLLNYQIRWQGQLNLNSKIIPKPFFLITNRHFPQKRLDYAILALAEILKESVNVFLVITGAATAYTKGLKNLVQKLDLEKNVIFTGLISEKELLELYSQAVVYLYTSPEEDFGMGVIEAMGAGIPVVAWDKGGPATTVLNDKTGYLVKPYSQKEFTKKIYDLLMDKKKNFQYGTNALSQVRRNFDYGRHNDLVEKTLLKAVIKGR
ncbi:MAG: glycosyltransferase family 4 protein [bacterium]|nr:glycosyltransferase family 4 protein [bacterium]